LRRLVPADTKQVLNDPPVPKNGIAVPLCTFTVIANLSLFPSSDEVASRPGKEKTSVSFGSIHGPCGVKASHIS
jgi:hypothetical protein